LGIVTNGSLEVQYAKIDTLHIRHYFDCIVISEEVGFRKPDPMIFVKAAEMLSMEPKECIYIGDLYNTDAVGAKKAGMKSCWFNPHGHQAPDGDVGPDYEIRNLLELLTILENFQPLE
jgi:putative hydrolase of the HAD superfamily